MVDIIHMVLFPPPQKRLLSQGKEVTAWSGVSHFIAFVPFFLLYNVQQKLTIFSKIIGGDSQKMGNAHFIHQHFSGKTKFEPRK